MTRIGFISDEELAQIRADSIFALKDSGVQGLPIDLEVYALESAITLLEKFLSAAISKGRGIR